MKKSGRLFSGLLIVALTCVGLAAASAGASTPTLHQYAMNDVSKSAPKAPPPAAPTPSTTIFSNLGPGGSYYQNTSWCVSGIANPHIYGCAGIQQSVAGEFTGNGSRVTQIKIALTNVAPSTNNATIQLAADNAGVPGAILGSWSVAQQPPFGGCCALTTVNVSPSIPVGYGKHYWVIANPGPNAFQNTEDGWNLTYNLSGGNVSFNSTGTGYTWETFYTYAVAMQVLGCGKLCGVG